MFGYPDALYRVIGHPVTWMGRAIGALETRLNRPSWSFPMRRAMGLLTLGLLLAATATVTEVIEALVPRPGLGLVILAVLCASLPAQRSLDRHVRAVADALRRDGIEAGRRAVSMIVGRNPHHLTEAGVARAAIESLAENFSDGIVAPAFWIVVGGLTGGALYKAVNTADSMIGHKTERYRAFGWAAARLDDLVNLPASRLAMTWLLLASLLTGDDTGGAARAVWHDASRHRSPNAGWPEAAMAGALGLRLGGPRLYGTERVDDGFMGDGRADASSRDIGRALLLYRTACALQWAVLVLFSLAVR